MANLFRKVTHELRLIPSIVAGLETFADVVAKPFMTRIGSYLKEGRELNAAHVTALQEAVAGMIADEGRQLEAAEKAHRDGLRQEKKIRQRRETAAEELYRILLRVRQIFEAFGPGTSVSHLGLEPGIGAVDSAVLLRYGRESLAVLSAPGFEAPDAASAEQLREHAGEIAPAVTELEAVVKEHEAAKRETQMALKLKNQRLESCHEAVTYGSRLNEALYVLAGEKFLAARLRPGVGRGGAVDPAPFPDDEGESDAGPPENEATAASEASEADDAPAS